jgi:hypothetical protein
MWFAVGVAMGVGGGCVPSGGPDSDLPPAQHDTPEIAEFNVRCDVDRAMWILQATATAWTGGGRLWMSRDAAYVEQHPVRAVRSAADGSAEDLRLELDFVSDWREQSAGASTAFVCEPPTAWRFVLFDLSGAPVDCRGDGDVVFPADTPACD